MSTHFSTAVIGLGGMGRTHIGAAQESPYIDRIFGYDPSVDQQKRTEAMGVKVVSLEEIRVFT